MKLNYEKDVQMKEIEDILEESEQLFDTCNDK
jgi:hypothetical protein